MIVLLAGETLAIWSVAAIGAALGGLIPWHRWRVHQRARERDMVRARLFALCPMIHVDREGVPRR